MLDHQAAFIYTMVIAAAAGHGMSDSEGNTIGDAVAHLPAFAGCDERRMRKHLDSCIELLKKDDGLDIAIKDIKSALPPRLRETAYLLACDVVASDGEATQEELRLLEMLRDRLSIDRLVAAAIERAARARFMTI